MNINNWVDLVLILLLLFPLFLVIFDSIYRLIFLIVVHLPAKTTFQGNNKEQNSKLLMLVVAHNEQRVIEQTLMQIKLQKDKDESINIAVLADHCSDQTISIAGNMGVEVYARREGVPGKAQALSWFVHEKQKLLSNMDIITILDADTLVDDEFCDKIREAFGPGVEVVQGFVNPVSKDGFPLTTLASYSELLAQKIDDNARSRLGWSVPLRGTGMAFKTRVFRQACQGLGTQVDDIELSVRLAELNVPVHYYPDAKILDPKIDGIFGLAKQRGRWLKGQRQIWRNKQYGILKLLQSDPANWSLIQAMLVKPKTALAFIKLILIGILLIGPLENIKQPILAITFVSILVDMFYYSIGLKYVGNTNKYLTALISSPLLLILWVISWAFSISPNQDWLRGRKE